MATIISSTEREEVGKWKWELETIAPHFLSVFGVYIVLLIYFGGYQEALCGVDLGTGGVVMEASPLLPAPHFPLLLLLHEEGRKPPLCSASFQLSYHRSPPSGTH